MNTSDPLLVRLALGWSALLTVDELAVQLRVDEEKIRERIEASTVRAYRPGRARLYRLGDVAELFAERPEPPAPPARRGSVPHVTVRGRR